MVGSIVVADLAILLDIPILREVFGFALLTFIPGLLIGCLLKTNLTFTEKAVLCVGLSLAFSMFLGALVNSLGPAIGVERPISSYPLLATMNLGLLTLIGVIHARKALPDFQMQVTLNHIKTVVSPSALFLILIPLLGALGALFVRYYGSTLVSALAILAIAFAVVLIAFGKFIPKNMYALALYAIGLTMLFSTSLISPYLFFGSDIHGEYYIVQLVQDNAHWDPNAMSENYSAMLSTTILTPAYSLFLDTDAIWIYKIVFPLIFAMLPIGLYGIFRSQIGERGAFLALFLFISFYAFYLVLPWIPRQQIGEIFLMLLVLVLVRNSTMGHITKTSLLIVFMASLIVSHYGTTYVFFALITLSCTFLFFMKVRGTVFTAPLVALGLVLAFIWYASVSQSSLLESVADLADHIHSVVTSGGYNSSTIDPDVQTALGAGIFDVAFWHTVGRIWQYVTQILITIGLTLSLLKWRESKFDREYLTLSTISMVILLVCIVVPYISSSLNMNRIYHLMLIFLSPFCIIGAEAIIRRYRSVFETSFLGYDNVKYSFLLLILIPYFLFHTGFIFEITENSSNLSFDGNQKQTDNPTAWTYLAPMAVPQTDVVACRWMGDVISTDKPVYADKNRGPQVQAYVPMWDPWSLRPDATPGQYIFLGKWNLWEGKYISADAEAVLSANEISLDDISPPLNARNRLYNNGGSVIYK
ncbi:MAG: DUF2206 domain-containing protein [Planctomycetes bacterium]|nr:DUF2206 domain-containing protein [Planctomycetota bacterium]